MNTYKELAEGDKQVSTTSELIISRRIEATEKKDTDSKYAISIKSERQMLEWYLTESLERHLYRTRQLPSIPLSFFQPVNLVFGVWV